ncbi:MAG: aldose 1-epimerase family protein [Ruminococcaceae bacterium]|nr:aldose 1-epimerase family protein [Oscillospiraceae bacterium]
MVNIKNEFLTVTINPFGAELYSIKGKDGYEYLWQGNPDVWSGRAPVLFPIVGGLLDDEFIYEEKAYNLDKHGFARLSDFEVETVEETKAVFLLKNNAELKKQYPFEFEFRVIFTLEKNNLVVEYKVNNIDTKNIYFSFGAHEAYSCPGGLKSYYVEFEKTEPLARYFVTGNFINGESQPLPMDGNKLYMNDEFFEDDAIILPDIASKKVWVKNLDNTHTIEVDYSGFKNLLIWTKPGAEYLCIEPWDGMPDYLDSDKKIENKKDIIALAENGCYSLVHTIKFD